MQPNEIAVEIMKHLVTCSSHGYSQYSRYGDGGSEQVEVDGAIYNIATGDRDCSSAVIDAWKQALKGTAYEGKLDGATYTGNMRGVFYNSGLFEIWDTNSTNAEPGDIYLNDSYHTAMCISGSNPDTLAEFSISERGTIDGAEGDQTGYESSIKEYYNYPWNCTLHYNGKANKAKVKEEKKGLFKMQNREFLYIVHPDKCGNLFLVDGLKIQHIPNEEALKYLKQEYKEVTGSDIVTREIGSKSSPEGFRLFQALGYEELWHDLVEPTIKD